MTLHVRKALAAFGCVTLLGAIGGAGCLTRPVVHQEPQTKTNFTSVVKTAAIDKVDILFAIDNSASMGDKQVLLAQAVPDFLTRLIKPNCVDDSGNAVLDANHQAVTASIANDGSTTCASGKPEFSPVHDMHIGIVTSSLGGRGADICNGQGAAGGGTRHDDDKGHLLNRASTIAGTPPAQTIDPSEHTTPDIEPSNYLAWLPTAWTVNQGKSDPVAVADGAKLAADFVEAIGGVHEYGCGIEAQLESWYRFLIQPDPYASIDVDQNSSRASLTGVDSDILKQRHDFLRPDSLVAIIVLTDEDDSAADPRAVSGQGWVYARSKFLGSCGGGAARGTSACDNVSTVNTAACTSCGFKGHESDPNCSRQGDVCTNTGQPQPGYYTFNEDTLNTRFVRMKQRYGIDPQFPISRYVNGLKNVNVPDRRGETYSGTGSDNQPNNSYKSADNCRNPLFAQNLPTGTDAGPNPTDKQLDALCNLTVGPRTSDLVFYAAITGVPWQLLTEHPDSANGEGNFLTSLNGVTDTVNGKSVSRWKRLVGNDPNVYDYTDIDPHMIQSQDPRPGISAGTSADDKADPWHGREWDTGKADLQYACTFPLPAPKDCNDPRYHDACDCTKTSGPFPPLCDATTKTTQVRGKAYPCIRELTVARDLGDQGIVASLCPRTLDTSNADYGYRPAVRVIVDRLKNALASQCLPQKLSADPTCSAVKCLILETLSTPAKGNSCGAFGLSEPDPTVLKKFRDQQAADAPKGDAGPGYIDPTTLLVCQLPQLVNLPGAPAGCANPGVKYVPFGASTCQGLQDPGWCYAEGQAAGGQCAQAILFSGGGQPKTGVKVSLQCIETATADAGP